MSEAWEKKWASVAMEKKWEEELRRQAIEERVRTLSRHARAAVRLCCAGTWPCAWVLYFTVVLLLPAASAGYACHAKVQVREAWLLLPCTSVAENMRKSMLCTTGDLPTRARPKLQGGCGGARRSWRAARSSCRSAWRPWRASCRPCRSRRAPRLLQACAVACMRVARSMSRLIFNPRGCVSGQEAIQVWADKQAS